MNLSLTCDLGSVPDDLRQLIGEDLPFTIARFLTMQAQDGQKAAIEKEKSGIFKLRNDWTTRNTKITPATKQKLVSEVYTDTGNRKTGAPDYLPMQEEGGDKVPVAGHQFLAIPTKYLRRIAPGVIPDALRPKNLFLPGVRVNVGDHFQGSFGANVGGKANRALGRAALRRLGTNEYIAFLQQAKGGTLCIFVRHGGIGHKEGHDAEPWYTLVRQAHIKPRFPMEQIVQQIVEANTEKNFDRAAAEVLANRALRGSLRVQF